jgi:hypothetical protein
LLLQHGYMQRAQRDEELHSEVRRTGIFVVRNQQTNQAPFRSDIVGICRPYGAWDFPWAIFLQRCRAYGAVMDGTHPPSGARG